LIFSWEGFTSLWPSTKGKAAYGDPKRALLYEPSSYPDYPQLGDGDFLDNLQLFQGLLVVAVRLAEGSGKLKTVSGDSASTINRLSEDASDILPASMRRTFAGDGLVTVRASQAS